MRLSQADTSSYLLLQEQSSHLNLIEFITKAHPFLLPQPGRTDSRGCSALPALGVAPGCPLAAEQEQSLLPLAVRIAELLLPQPGLLMAAINARQAAGTPQLSARLRAYVG